MQLAERSPPVSAMSSPAHTPQRDQRRLNVFFYGLFMDPELLVGKGIHPAEIRLAVVPGFVLRIGARAALVPTPGGEVHGVLMNLSHADLSGCTLSPASRRIGLSRSSP
jgi:hypothetical protein